MSDERMIILMLRKMRRRLLMFRMVKSRGRKIMILK